MTPGEARLRGVPGRAQPACRRRIILTLTPMIPMPRLTSPVFALAPPLLASCGHEHAYVTAGPGAAGAAARYPFPVVQPRGEIFTTSFGLVEAELEAQQPARLLHARIVVVNRGPDTWTIDAREQLVELGG